MSLRYRVLALVAELLAIAALAYPLLAYPGMITPLAARLGVGTTLLGLGLVAVISLLVLAGHAEAAYVVLAVLAGYSSALAGGARYAEVLIASLLVSSLLVTLSLRWRLLSRSGVSAKPRCSTDCLALNAGGIVLTYSLLGLATYYGAFWGLSLYKYALSRPESIGGPMAIVWRLLASSPTIRFLVALSIVAIFYYVLSRLVSPIIYALTASPEALRREIEKLERQEAMEVLARKKWYHRMLGSSLLLTGFVTESAIAFMTLIPLYLVLGGAEATRTTRYLLSLLSLLLGYALARSATRLIGAPRKTWVKIALLALTGLVALAAYISLTDPTGLNKVIRVLDSPFTGQQPPYFSKDPELGLELATYEGYIYKISRFIEHVARLIVELLWG